MLKHRSQNQEVFPYNSIDRRVYSAGVANIHHRKLASAQSSVCSRKRNPLLDLYTQKRFDTIHDVHPEWTGRCEENLAIRSKELGHEAVPKSHYG